MQTLDTNVFNDAVMRHHRYPKHIPVYDIMQNPEWSHVYSFAFEGQSNGFVPTYIIDPVLKSYLKEGHLVAVHKDDGTIKWMGMDKDDLTPQEKPSPEDTSSCKIAFKCPDMCSEMEEERRLWFAVFNRVYNCGWCNNWRETRVFLLL